MASPVLGTAFVSIEARTDKFLASAQKGVSGALAKLGGSISKPLVDATGKAGADAGRAFSKGLGGLGAPLALLLGIRELNKVVLGGVDDFVALGKSVERFSTVAGTSAEVSSRFISVADDFGVAADQASLSIGFLAKTLGNNADALAGFNVNVVKTAKGTIDFAKTAFNVIDAYDGMTDTTRKAALGAAAFGRGYQALIPILTVGSKAIQNAFANAPASQVFDDKKLAQAKQLGVTMDSIRDSVLNVQLALAEGLAPALSGFSHGLETAAGAVSKADGATGGALATLTKFGVAAAGSAGTILVLGGAVKRAATAFQQGIGATPGLGIAAKGTAGALAALGVILAAEDILNKVTSDSERGKRALDELTLGLNRVRDAGGPSAQSLGLLVQAAKELEASKGDFDKTADAFKVSGPFNLTVSKAKLNLLNFKEALDKSLAADPNAGAQIRTALIEAANAADAGDIAQRKYLDSLGLTDVEIDKLVTKLNLQTIAQSKAAGATDEGSAALRAQADDLHRLTSAIPFNTVIRQNLLDLEAKQKIADQELADSTQKLTDRYNAQQDALNELKQAKIDVVDLALSEEQAHFDATQAVEAYRKALAGVPASVKDIADAEKQLADARVAFQKLLLAHPPIITPEFVLEKEAAQAAIGAAQANLDEVKKGQVSTPEEIRAAFLNAERAINAEAKAAADAKAGLLKSLGKPFTLDDETAVLIANLREQEKAFGKNSALGKAIEETIVQLHEVAKAQIAITTEGITFQPGDTAGPSFRFMAKGGPFKKGQPFVAGEDGWELIIPDADGKVLTHQQSVAAMVGGQMANRARVASTPPVAPVANSRPLTGDVHITESPDGRQTFSEMVRALRARQFLAGAN